ncbi:chemotaxis protein CheW [Methylobacterium nodulans]|uniref:CheW protein n=1 Tax=Methylobacterium nodulans (strain LMG 21967 / CNCM I-2342 / ORS 2060) TaxID=460265 RepID=B8IF82_METNO|nr:chemotaxis protein CheW [Methylobacterium nodulans]ACL55793.1 CheW protein [Methylobacterium nodulans ORS 2060]
MPDPAQASPGSGERALVVALGRDRLALPGARIRAILRPPALTRLPGLPPALAGLAHLRGLPLPVLDLRRLLNREDDPAGAAGRMVVADAGEPVGLMVDRVIGLTGRSPDADAGAELLDLPQLVAAAFPHPARPWRAETGRAAPTGQSSAAGRVALIDLRVAGRPYALPLDGVAEVTTLPPDWQPDPEAGPVALGPMQWRGGRLPLLWLAGLLGIAADGPAAGTHAAAGARVVVVRSGGVGLVVDSLGPVFRLAPEAIDPLPPVLRRTGRGTVAAIARLGDGDLVPILSLDRLLAGVVPAAEAARSGQTDGEARAARPEAVLVIAVAGERYGLPAAAVTAVLRLPAAITRLPHAPACVAGLVALRGAAVPVIDLRRRLGRPAGTDPRSRIIALEVGGQRMGLLVDEVSRLRHLETGAIRPPPEGLDAAVTRAAALGTGDLLPLLDPSGLLDAAWSESPGRGPGGLRRWARAAGTAS